MKIWPILLAVCFASINSDAQTITTHPISGGWLCPNDSIDVAFNATGKFESYNVFKVQISNDTFATFETIASAPGTSSDTIRVFISRGMYESDHYRIRVVSTAPYVQGTDNGSDLILPDVANFHMGGTRARLLPYDTTRFSLMKSHKDYFNPDFSYSWNFGKDAYPSSSNQHSPPPVYYLSPGEKTVTLDIKFSETCSYTLVGGALVADCYPKIPSNAQIIDPDTSFGPYTGQVWVRGGAEYSAEWRDTIYAEPGSIIRGLGQSSVLFLKPGAEAIGVESRVIIYAEGAQFDFDRVALRCPDLEFNYSDAPSPDDFARVNFKRPDLTIEKIASRIELHSSSQRILSVEVYDLLGKLVFQRDEINMIETLGWTPGTYFVRARIGKSIVSKSFNVGD